MTETQATLVHHRTIFDGWWSATIGTYIALVGYYVLVVFLSSEPPGSRGNPGVLSV